MPQLERVLQENNKPRGGFFSALSPRRAGKSKPPPKPQAAQPAPRAPPPPGGLCRSSKAHLEALAALAAVDNLSDLDTPDIVVIGTQSSGKSSLINALTGFDLMPTGTGMVTQAPLRLVLEHSGSDSLLAELGPVLPAHAGFEGGGGGGTTGGTFKLSVPPTAEQQEALRQAISAVGRALAPNPMSITRETITLRLASSRLSNMSLIDLPGLTSVPLVSQGQPEDIREQLRDLVASFAANPRATIVLVSQATGDLEADQAFELVRRLDPRLERTVGVLTKADLATRDADVERVCSFLSGNASAEVVPKRGRFAVCVNGGERGGEQAFFQTSPLGNRARTRGCGGSLGSPQLASFLAATALQQLVAATPAILQQAQQMRERAQRRLTTMAPSVPTDDTSRHLLLNTLLMHTAREIETAHRSASRSTGYRIKLAFERLEAALNRLNPFEDLVAWERLVHEAVRNHEGWGFSMLQGSDSKVVQLAPPALSESAKREERAESALAGPSSVGHSLSLYGLSSDLSSDAAGGALYPPGDPVYEPPRHLPPIDGSPSADSNRRLTASSVSAAVSGVYTERTQHASGGESDLLDSEEDWGSEPPPPPPPPPVSYPMRHSDTHGHRRRQSRRSSLMDDELSRGFLPKDVIQLLLGEHSAHRPLHTLFEPCCACLREVTAELRAVVEEPHPQLTRFPRLVDAVRGRAGALLDRLAYLTEEEIGKMIDMEEAYVFVTRALLRRMEREGAHREPCSVLRYYFDDVRQAVAKAVPKLVITYLCRQLEAKVGEELFGVAYTPGLLEEVQDKAKTRAEDEATVRNLIRVEEALAKLPLQ